VSNIEENKRKQNILVIIVISAGPLNHGLCEGPAVKVKRKPLAELTIPYHKYKPCHSTHLLESSFQHFISFFIIANVFSISKNGPTEKKKPT